MSYRTRNLLMVLLLPVLFGSCSENKKNLSGLDIELFQETPVWDLAKAVRDENVDEIKRILMYRKVKVDYQEPTFGESLLLWAVWSNHYKSAKALLEGGANPNLPDHQDGKTPFIFSAEKFETSDYLKLLLTHGGNINFVTTNDSTNMYTTPLVTASYHRLESVKLLVDAGADINYVDKGFRSPLSAAFTFKKVEIIRYLLIDKGAQYDIPMGETVDGKPLTIANHLRTLVFPLDSKQYKVKMEIVKYLKTKGIDYFKTPIPRHYHKNYNKDFLERY
ncbi:ankyrin repeat domain-containing protein [Mucilaginibacter calamicampi]|uniref:Ankyrin repeat domain-containing protein n=1 Tax=Mucilaginibacter calamicampi TaxID=1302352 RepID=A0ABW2Z0A1_9SPHI